MNPCAGPFLEREARNSGAVGGDANNAWTRYYIPRDSQPSPPSAVVYRGPYSGTFVHRINGSADGQRRDPTRKSPMWSSTPKERIRVTRPRRIHILSYNVGP